MKAGWIAAVVLLVAIALAAVYYLSPHASGDEGTMVDLISSNGTVATVSVELADTPDEQEKGLMYRTSMDDNKGMLFVFNGDLPRSFWMRNTPLPLDMVFVDSSFNIVDINRNATPNSEIVFTSSRACKYVVEVNGGFCDVHGIGVGDRIRVY